MMAGSAGRPRRAHAGKRYLYCALGILSAALLFELALRPFVADSTSAGVGGAPIRTIRSYLEGISVSHLEPSLVPSRRRGLQHDPSRPG